jgi:hypothetical protein
LISTNDPGRGRRLGFSAGAGSACLAAGCGLDMTGAVMSTRVACIALPKAAEKKAR